MWAYYFDRPPASSCSLAVAIVHAPHRCISLPQVPYCAIFFELSTKYHIDAVLCLWFLIVPCSLNCLPSTTNASPSAALGRRQCDSCSLEAASRSICDQNPTSPAQPAYTRKTCVSHTLGNVKHITTAIVRHSLRLWEHQHFQKSFSRKLNIFYINTIVTATKRSRKSRFLTFRRQKSPRTLARKSWFLTFRCKKSPRTISTSAMVVIFRHQPQAAARLNTRIFGRSLALSALWL